MKQLGGAGHTRMTFEQTIVDRACDDRLYPPPANGEGGRNVELLVRDPFAAH